MEESFGAGVMREAKRQREGASTTTPGDDGVLLPRGQRALPQW